MKPVLLVDFGSTYTKITAVDTDTNTLLGTAASFTTVETDINEGLKDAIRRLEPKTGILSFSETYACSSAAGGLRMIAIGLVPELTVQASREATLGAGAKVMKTYSFQLTKGDIKEINALHPDIILVTGGTDGGNSECILHNSKMLCGIKEDIPIVIAGNRCCADDCEELLDGHQVSVCENVMPVLGKLNILPAQQKIREIFLKKIVQGKGLSKTSELVSGIIMPTPSAMLTAMELLSGGCTGESGIGELIGIDLGGATTDVYSVADGTPASVRTVYKGIQEPYAKRTVEGDIGMRYSISGIVEAWGIQRIAQLSSLNAGQVTEQIAFLEAHKDTIPDNEMLRRLDFALASAAVETAVKRHAGKIEQVYTPMGEAYLQSGKDLRGTENVIVSGGALIHSQDVIRIAEHAFFDKEDPSSLRPEHARIGVDKRYILAAMGLLSKTYPQAALEIMKREIIFYGNEK